MRPRKWENLGICYLPTGLRGVRPRKSDRLRVGSGDASEQLAAAFGRHSLLPGAQKTPSRAVFCRRGPACGQRTEGRRERILRPRPL